jgi:TonB family protein
MNGHRLMHMKPLLILVMAEVVMLSAFAQDPPPAPSLRAINLRAPEYPPIAVAARVSGEVDLKITLLDDGTLGTVEVESGPQMLRQAAVESAKGSKFPPATKERASESYALIYRFVLKLWIAASREMHPIRMSNMTPT